MTLITRFTAMTLLCCHVYFSQAQSPDAVKKTNHFNKTKAAAGIVDKEVSEFLVQSADARMMDKKEGAMAAKSGTTPAVRAYGRLMVKDQTMLLGKIQRLAVARNISLPKTISNNKEDGRKDLQEKTGRDFDKKFIKMMRLDHERDIKIFNKGIELKDKEVSRFAETYLPTIQKHLDKLNLLKENSQ